MNENSKKKKSLRAIISKIVTALVFVSGLAFMGVAFALQSVSVNMSGQVIFNAKSVYCDITGAISGMSTNPTLEKVEIRNGENDASTLSPTTWQNLVLDFASETSEIEVLISIHNLSEDRALYVSIDDAFGSISNLTTVREVGTGASLEESDLSMIEISAEETKNFKFTLSITNTSKSISGNFTLAINLDSQANVTSTEEFLSTLSSSSTAEKYCKLTQDIDLTSIGATSTASTLSTSTYSTSSFTKYDDVYALFESFKGVIDGGNHKIKMNATGENGSAFLFGKLEGVVKNITLEFNSDGVVSSLAYITGDLILENVTATGSVTILSADGYSPLVSKAKGSYISFINCTNDVDITADSGYGSAFLGNRVYGTKAADAGKKYMNYSSENTVSDTSIETIPNLKNNNTSNHIIVNNMLTFSGCTNTGTIQMPDAALFYGNVYELPDRDCIVVENCVNNGLIIGATSVGYINQMRAGELNNNGTIETWSKWADREFWHRGQYLTDLESYVAENVTGSGSKTSASLPNLSVSKNDSNQIVISNTNSGTYEYAISIQADYKIMKNGQVEQTLSCSAVFTIASLPTGGNTGIKYLSVGYITNTSNKTIQVGYKSYTYKSLETVTNSNMTLTGIATGLKIATLSDETQTQVYVFDISTSETVTFKPLSMPMRIATYEVTGTGRVLKDVKKSI